MSAEVSQYLANVAGNAVVDWARRMNSEHPGFYWQPLFFECNDICVYKDTREWFRVYSFAYPTDGRNFAAVVFTESGSSVSFRSLSSLYGFMYRIEFAWEHGVSDEEVIRGIAGLSGAEQIR